MHESDLCLANRQGELLRTGQPLDAIIADCVNVFCEVLMALIANICDWFIRTYAQKRDPVTNKELYEIRCLILVKLHRRTGGKFSDKPLDSATFGRAYLS